MGAGAGALARALAALLAVAAAGSAEAQTQPKARLIGPSVQDRASGVLQLLGYTAVPDSTAASLQVTNKSSGDPTVTQTQFGGGFTISDGLPVYLEGFLGATRYDPTFVFSDGTQESALPTKWTGFAATGGIGYDFPLTDRLVFRPILNLSLGYVTSDLNALLIFIDAPDVEFLDGGDLFAGGVGGSVMLDYELRRPGYEVDIELRYTHLHLFSLPGTDNAAEGEADAQTAAIWSRLRIPVGDIAGRPFRYVFEAAHSSFLGAQRGILGFDDLSQLGIGVEVDTEQDKILLTRTRLVARYVFGEDVSGWSLGVGISF